MVGWKPKPEGPPFYPPKSCHFEGRKSPRWTSHAPLPAQSCNQLCKATPLTHSQLTSKWACLKTKKCFPLVSFTTCPNICALEIYMCILYIYIYKAHTDTHTQPVCWPSSDCPCSGCGLLLVCDNSSSGPGAMSPVQPSEKTKKHPPASALVLTTYPSV